VCPFYLLHEEVQRKESVEIRKSIDSNDTDALLQALRDDSETDDVLEMKAGSRAAQEPSDQQAATTTTKKEAALSPEQEQALPGFEQLQTTQQELEDAALDRRLNMRSLLAYKAQLEEDLERLKAKKVA
jgi:hypothetical protein